MSKIDRNGIAELVTKALENLGGSAHIHDVSKELWSLLKKRGITEKDDIFYTWQYDMRWASHKLRNSGNLQKSNISNLPKGYWKKI